MMKKVTSMAGVVALILLAWLSLAAAGADAPAARPSGIVVPVPLGGAQQPHDATSILVRFKPVTLKSRRASVRSQINGTRLRAYSMVAGLEHIRLTAGTDVEQALNALRRLPFVAYAHRNHVIYLHQQSPLPPDDSYFNEQWALHNTGQGSSFGIWLPGIPDADIDWPAAWAKAGNNGSVVAILDTGIDYGHSDLGPNVWQNITEANGIAGVDDDNNGYVDDIRGWDFVNNDNDPLDGHGHGTHVAGIVAAVTNNGNGITGVMWSGQVMALKILDDQGFGLLSDAIAALEYATANGVRVSNSSWGYSSIGSNEVADHQALYDAIEASAAANHLFVASAGNDTVNTDTTPQYPSTFDLDNIISVAATDNNDQLAWFSNWGPSSVDLAAPGQDVFSTYMRFAGSIDDYAWQSGTSMAAPHVSAVAGLLTGLSQCTTYQQVRDQILNNVRTNGALSGLTVTDGLLNIDDTMNGGECVVTAPPLTIDAISLPNARFGFSYASQLTASGGVAPYTWSLNCRSLPPGITLDANGSFDGLVFGPSVPYEFTVEVTDSDGTTATQSLSITVDPRPACGYCHEKQRHGDAFY